MPDEEADNKPHMIVTASPLSHAEIKRAERKILVYMATELGSYEEDMSHENRQFIPFMVFIINDREVPYADPLLRGLQGISVGGHVHRI